MKLSKPISNSILLGSAVLAASLTAVAPAFAQTNIYTWDGSAAGLSEDDLQVNKYLWDVSDQDQMFENDIHSDAAKDYRQQTKEDGETYISFNNSIGYHQSITTSFDSVSNVLTWNSVFEKKGDNQPNGGWLVLTEGPNPKHLDGNHAIFYMDGLSGRLSAFTKDSTGHNSYQNSNFLGSWDNAVNIVDNGTERSMSFSVDVSSILNANVNTGFDDTVGIWFHATQHNEGDIQYDENGKLTAFTNQGKGWFDSEGVGLKTIAVKPTAAQVPEPATGLLGLGLIGWGTSSMKRRLASLKNRKA